MLSFARAIVGLLPQPAATPAQDGIEWLEIQRWAHEIAQLVPGFPDERAIRDPDMLAQVCATLIWNAAVVHSADHATLHMMIDKHPVPFILRIKPPADQQRYGHHDHRRSRRPARQGLRGRRDPRPRDAAAEDARGKFGTCSAGSPGKGLDTLADDLVDSFDSHQIVHGSVPLCWPTDLVYCKMADLLFYRPHNSSLLYDCGYASSSTKHRSRRTALRKPGRRKASRPVLDDAERGALRASSRDVPATA